MSDTPLIMRPDSREYKERAAAKARQRAISDPITAETPMKERLARILGPIAWSERYKPNDRAHAQQYAMAKIDQLLAELEEPSEGPIIAGVKAMEGWDHTSGTVIVGQPRDVWKAMIQHIRNEG